MVKVTPEIDIEKGSYLVLLKNGTGNLQGTLAGTLFQFKAPDSSPTFCSVENLTSGRVHYGLMYYDENHNPRFRLAYKNEEKSLAKDK